MIAAVIGSVAFFFASILYILLALGLPYGEFAMGGKYRIIPTSMRYMCAFSVLIQWFAILILLQTAGLIPFMFSSGITKGLCYFFAVYLSINSVMNALSKSKKEKYIITPLSVITAICFWVTAVLA
jgi:hypothetical protein